MDLDRSGIQVVKETYLSRSPRSTSTRITIATIGIVWISSVIYWSNFWDLSSSLPVSKIAVFGNHEFWRLFTAMGIHADLRHLLSNLIPLALLSYLLYGFFGPWVFPTLTTLLGAGVNLISIWTYPPNTRLLGASGVVYLMAGFWITSYLLIHRKYSPWNRILRCSGFCLILLVPSSMDPTVSYRTHFIGFALGIGGAALLFICRKKWFRAFEVIEVERDID